MVELIGEDDQPMDLSQVLMPAMAHGVVSSGSAAVTSWGAAGAAGVGAASERLPLYEPMARIEPGKIGDDLPSFENGEPDIGFDTESGTSLDKTVVMDESDGPLELEVDEFSEFEDGDANEPFTASEPSLIADADSAGEPEFNSDQFDPVDETELDNADPYQTIVEEGDRIPVTGPVAPRPLGTTTSADFGGGPLNAKPRRKKQGSPLLHVAGVILGGIASIPLAAGVLYMAGVSPDFGFWPFDGSLVKKPEISVSQPMELREERVTRPPQNGRSLAEDLNPQASNAFNEEASASDNALAMADSSASAASGNAGLDDLAKDLANAANSDATAFKPETTIEEPSDLSTPLPSTGGSEAADELTMPDISVPANNIATAAESPSNPNVAPEPVPDNATGLTMPAEITTVAEAAKPEPVKPEPVKPDPEKSEPVKPNPVSDVAIETEAPMKPSTVEPSFDDIVSNGLKGEPAKPTSETPAKPPVEPSSTSPSPIATNAENANVKPATAPKPQEPAKASPELVRAIERSDAALKAVLDFADATDVKGLKRSKAMLYETLAGLATVPSDPSNPETLELVGRVAEAGLMKDLTTAAPNWLRYTKRPNNGLFAVGRAEQSNGDWILKWNGSADLQLKNVSPTAVKSGDEVVIIGTIVDTAPPAIVRVTFIYPKPAS